MRMKINRERWDVMNAILDELLELPEAERLDKLRDYCVADSTLFNDIAALLKECESDDSLLDQNALNLAHTLLDQLAPASIASTSNALCNVRVGAYVLKKEIGRGGMGVVYQAERSQGDFVQTVAIKLLLNVNVSVSERFRREQQALATLNHPNITQLLDAGISEQGLPYLIMEYIEGVPITDYCTEKNLTLPERLAVLDQVADALAFSHKNLIVHRDIKPSNILVTATGQIKLLDFSIAKLLDTQWALEETATHLHLLTPSYSAPEQVLNQSITVATDIYQLGLLYYRVLTGHSPLVAEINSLHELVKIVCDGNITRPSQVVLTSVRQEETLLDLPDLRKFLSGDLDEIILKMLRKEPASRYPSIEAFKADIYAYRHNLPVAAHQAAFNYQAKKYFKRNWRTIALVGVATISLAVYAVSMKMQNTRVQLALAKAQVEQHKAEQVAQFLSQTFEAADPNKGGLKGITAYDLLENARTKINEDLKDLPEVQAPLLNLFSKIYFRQQDYTKAEALLANLLNNPKNAQQLDKKLLAEIQVRLAQQKIGLGQFIEAEALLRQSLNLQDGLRVSDAVGGDPLYGETLTFLANTLFAQRHRIEAIQVVKQSIEYLFALGDQGDRIRSFALNIYANDKFLFGDVNGAIENMREAVSLKQKVLGVEHTETSNTQLGLARMLIDREDLIEAQSLAESAFENIRNHLSPEHPYQASGLGVLAKLAQKKHQYDKALDLVRRQSSISGNASKMYADLTSIDILIEQGELVEAQSIIDRFRTKDGGRNFEGNIAARLLSLEGRLNLSLGEIQKSLALFNRALDLLDQDQMEAIFVKRDKAAALQCAGEKVEASKIFNEVIRALSQRYKPDHTQVQTVCLLIAYSMEGEMLFDDELPCSKHLSKAGDAQLPSYFMQCFNQSVNDYQAVGNGS